MDKNKISNNRIISIDLLRILSMIMIFLFHSNIHLDCTYGIFTTFISHGAVFMDMFFIISGFSIFYTNYMKDLHSVKEIKKFYIKRIASIYPAYLLICGIYLVFNIDKDFSVFNKIAAFPMDVLMLQSTVNGTFDNLHHGGTWFISCLFFCYLLSPFFIEILKQLRYTKLLYGGGVLYLICAYIPIAVHIIGYDTTYSSVIYRGMQFFIGMIVASAFLTSKPKFSERKCAVITFSVLLILILGVSLLKHYIGGTFSDHDFFVIPCCVIIVYFSAFLTFKGKLTNRIAHSKVIKYLNSFAYEFWLGQFFCFDITQKIVEKFELFDTNIMKIIISLIICFIVAVILHELISKPCKRVISNKFIKDV